MLLWFGTQPTSWHDAVFALQTAFSFLRWCPSYLGTQSKNKNYHLQNAQTWHKVGCLFLSICLTHQEKMLFADLILRKEIENSTLLHSLKETGKTRFDGIINTAGGRSKQRRHFSTRWQLSISQFFTLSAGWMVMKYPIPNGFQRFRHLPHIHSRLLSPCYLQLWQTADKPADSIYYFAANLQFTLINCSTFILLFLATLFVK